MGRAEVIRDVLAKRIRQRQAARRLGVGVRQVKRLVKRYREQGAAGLISRRRGQRSSRAFSAPWREEVMAVVRRRYPDFGRRWLARSWPRAQGLRLSDETLRQWMIADGLWKPRSRRAVRIHQSRPRRDCVGDWFRSTVAARLVRGSRAGLYADRVYRRRHQPADGDGFSRRRRRRRTWGRCARTWRRTVARWRFTRPLRCLPGQREGPGRRVTAVHASLENAGYRADSRWQPASEGTRGAGQSDTSGSAGQGDAAARHRRLGGGQRVPAGVHGGLQPALAVAPRNPLDAHREVLRDAAELDLILCEHHARKLTKN